MPGKVKVKVIAGRNLPVMDRSSETTDAYVEIKLGGTTYKTDVCRKSLHPQWNSEWYRFEVDDAELQDEPLQMRLMDHDTYSANDAIGKVYLDLNPLLLPSHIPKTKYGLISDSTNLDSSTNTVLSGWIPVYDTMHGIRGEVNVIVKVELFSDLNRFRQSSCGVHFFYSPTIPYGYYAQAIYGFVEELVVNGDPEYQWIDKIRTPRASNEARQTLFFKLSGELQRKIGVKALELGANSVIGYHQCFDLEGESGIVARGIGTAALLVKISHMTEHSLVNDETYHTESFRLNVELFNKKFLYPSQNRQKFIRSQNSITSSKSFDQPLTLRPITLFRGTSLRSLIDQEHPGQSHSLRFSQRVKNFKNHFMKDKDLSLESIIHSRKSKTRVHHSAMAEKLVLSILDCYKDLPPVLEHKDCPSDQSFSERHSDKSNENISDSSDDCSLEESSSTASSVSNNVENMNGNAEIAGDTVSEILRNVEGSSKKTGLIRQRSFSLTDVSSHCDSSLLNTSSCDVLDTSNQDEECVLETKNTSEDDSGCNVERCCTSLGSLNMMQGLRSEEPDQAPPKCMSSSNVASYPKARNRKFASYSSSFLNDPRIILPKINVTDNFKKENLVETAMKTMLLEKASIVGTYTAIIPEKTDIDKEQETVLGMPFQSLSTLLSLKNSNDELNESGFMLHKTTPLTEIMKTKSCSHLSDHDKTRSSNGLMEKLKKLKKGVLSSNRQKSFSSDDVRPKKRFATLSESRDVTPISTRSFKVESDTCLKVPEIRTQNTLVSSSDLPPHDYNCDCVSPSIFKTALSNPPNNKHASSNLYIRYSSSPIPDSFHADHHRSESVGTKVSHSPGKTAHVACIHRRSSDSDLSITPKGNSLTGSDRSVCLVPSSKHNILLRSIPHQGNFDMLEYPFLTINKYPSGFILHLGGAVSARSVKLLERISNIEEPETRDSWWSELRMEIRSHARALNCNAVLGYTESTSICEDVCVLSASGTAAVIQHSNVNETFDNMSERNELDKEKTVRKDLTVNSQELETEHENILKHSNSPCTMCHLPYSSSLQIRSSSLKCALCRNGKVPEVLITTIELPDGTSTMGRGCFLQSSVHRSLKDVKGEYIAKEISDGLPFLEYELHRILVNKLKIKGMNAIFGLKVRISIGERMLIGIATGTAVFLTALHPPVLPKLVSDRSVDEKKLADLQKRLKETVKKNRQIYQLKNVEDIQTTGRLIDDSCEGDIANLELSLGNKDSCLLEVDDPDDVEIVNLLIEESPPNGIHIVNTEFVPGLEEMEAVKNLQMFEQIYRSKMHYPFSLNQHFLKLLQCIYFKLRRMVPCAVCDLQFRVDVPEADEVQISVLGMVLGLGDTQKTKSKRKNAGMKSDELIFNLEEVDIPENGVINISSGLSTGTSGSKKRHKSPLKIKRQNINDVHIPYKERHGVDITPLSYVPGGKIERYLGNLNFFLIRETTSIREEGGLSGFIHSFATEVLAIVRAHVTALGGNGMVSYFLTECVLNYNLHKNQGQCLINVGGDVVFVSYYKDD